jgi:hypothetical protein
MAHRHSTVGGTDCNSTVPNSSTLPGLVLEPDYRDGLRPVERFILKLLEEYSYGKGETFVSTRKLCIEMNLSRSQIQRILAKMVKLGKIVREKIEVIDKLGRKVTRRVITLLFPHRGLKKLGQYAPPPGASVRRGPAQGSAPPVLVVTREFEPTTSSECAPAPRPDDQTAPRPMPAVPRPESPAPPATAPKPLDGSLAEVLHRRGLNPASVLEAAQRPAAPAPAPAPPAADMAVLGPLVDQLVDPVRGRSLVGRVTVAICSALGEWTPLGQAAIRRRVERVAERDHRCPPALLHEAYRQARSPEARNPVKVFMHRFNHGLET